MCIYVICVCVLIYIWIWMTLDHKTSHKGKFLEIEIKRNVKFDACSVLLAIAANIPVLLMTGFVVQGHIYIYIYIYICMYVYVYTYTNMYDNYLKVSGRNCLYRLYTLYLPNHENNYQFNSIREYFDISALQKQIYWCNLVRNVSQ